MPGEAAADPGLGWKDPRTTLFRDFWRSVSPEMHFVLLYRQPMAVVESPLRRDTDPQLKVQPWRAAQSWLGSNRLLLEFAARNSECTTLVNISGFNKHHVSSAALLGRRIGVELAQPYTVVYRPSEIVSEVQLRRSIRQRLIAAWYRKSVAVVYSALEKAAYVTEHGPVQQDTV